MSSETGKQRPRRSRLKIAAWLLLALLVATLALLAWLAGTTAGARAMLSVIARNSGGALHFGDIDGRLAGPLRVQQISIHNDGMQAELKDVQLDWRPLALLQGRVHVTALRIDSVGLRQRVGQPEEPASTPRLPASLALPLQLRIDTFEVGRGNLDWGALPIAELGGFALQLDYDGARYRMALREFSARSAAPGSNGASAAHSFSGALSGAAELADRPPYAVSGGIDATAQARVRQQDLAGSGRLTLGGSLENLQAMLDFAIGDARLNGSAVLQPFSGEPLTQADIELRAIDLATFSAGLPQTRIDGRLTATAQGGRLALTNQAAGTHDASMLPLRQLALNFRQQERRLYLDGIDAALGSAGAPAGNIRGNGNLLQGGLVLDLKTDALDLQRLDKRLLATRLAGGAKLRTADGRQHLALSLQEPLGRQQLALSLQASMANDEIALERAELALGQGRLHADGRLHLAGRRAFSLKGTLSRLRVQDLGRFAQLPELYLNGDFSASGELAPQPLGDLEFRIADSRLAGQPLQGEGRASLRADRLDVPNLRLAAGANSLAISGSLRQEGGQLQFKLEAPQLAQFGAGFGGKLQAEGNARGSFTQPRVTATWLASQVRLPGLLRLDDSRGNADLRLDRNAPWMLGESTIEAQASGMHAGAAQLESFSAALRYGPQATAPLSLRLQANKFAAGEYRADRLSLDADGTTGNHAISAALTEAGQQWQLRASGALQPQALRWQGSIDQLSGTGRRTLRLAAPAPLELSHARSELRQFVLQADGATIEIARLLRDSNGLQSRGRFDRLPLALLLEFVRPQPQVETDLQFAGEWDFTMGKVPQGAASLRRQQGDLGTRGLTPVKLGLRWLDLGIKVEDGRARLELHADGSNLGRIDLEAGVALDRASPYGIAPQAALSGHARLAIPSLRWAGTLIAPNALADGSLEGAFSMGGTFAEPRLSGQLTGNNLRLGLPELGVDLRGGSLDAAFQGSRLEVRQLAFAHGGGQLTIAGPIELAGAEPDVRLEIKAQRYPLLDRSDRKLVVSGNGNVALEGGRLQVSGGLSADSGMFDLGQADKPSLSDDVVILGATSRKPVTPLALDLVIGLGEGINIRGYGLDALLVGQVQFRNAAGQSLHAEGAMRVLRGTIKAYGRELEIDKGFLFFNGAPGNPGLDILAMRRGQQVEAGVAILGTALSPRIVLVSDPPVADAEKLSWLVLGRGLNASSSGEDLTALQGAAAALLTQGASAGVQAGLASAFGLDEFSVGTSNDSLQQHIVTIGKQVSSRLHIGIERGLETASSVLQLRYTISRKLSLEIDTGDRTAFTVFYNFAFD